MMSATHGVGPAQYSFIPKVTQETKGSSGFACFREALSAVGNALCTLGNVVRCVVVSSVSLISFAVLPGAAIGAGAGALVGGVFVPGVGAAPGAIVGAVAGGCMNVVSYVGFACMLKDVTFNPQSP